MNNLKKFVKQLHQDESAPEVVEWMMLITVALLVMSAVYYISRWAIKSTGEAVQKVKDAKPSNY